MTSQAENFCRNRRLFDVRRGVVYLRRTDNLAQHQWRHYGAVPAIKTHVIRDIGVTTRLPAVTSSQDDTLVDESLTETRDLESDVRGSESDVRESVSDAVNVEQPTRAKHLPHKTTLLEKFNNHPQILVTEAMTDTAPVTSRAATEPRTDSSNLVPPEHQSAGQPAAPTTSSSLSSPPGDKSWADSGVLSNDLTLNPSFPAFRQPLSTSKPYQHSFRESLSFPEGVPGGALFDTWGSRDWEAGGKLTADVTPKNHSPKRYPLMSRVAGAGMGKKETDHRQLKTLTDFRSQNGTVRINRPLPPIPGIKKHHVLAAQDPYDDLDLDTLEREKTYAMLKRIDRLLEPTRAFFTSDLTSSQREVCSSTPSASDLTDFILDSHQHGPQLHQAQNHVHVHHADFHKYFAEENDSDLGHVNGLSREPDSHQGYYDRIQARLAQFYGHTGPLDHPLKDVFQGRTTPLRGHSEPPRERPDSFPEHLSDLTQTQNRFFRAQNDHEQGRSVDNLQGTLESHARPGAAHSRPLPPLKNPSTVSKEAFPDPHNKHHSHSWNSRNARSRRNGSKGVKAGGGERGKGWGTLSEVVKNLEKKGVDLHMKCKDWINASFS